MTDGAQLAKIKDDIKQAVTAPYRDMLDKYGALETSKGNTSKYVKYTPETINAEIDKIFDLSAWSPPPLLKKKSKQLSLIIHFSDFFIFFFQRRTTKIILPFHNT